MGDPGRNADGHARAGRCREGKVARIDARRRERDHVLDLAVSDTLLQRRVVEQVPRSSAGLARRRLHEVVLRPGDLTLEELFAPLVVDARVTPVELRGRDELRFGEVRIRHVASVELGHSRGQLGAALERETQAVAAAPGVRT